MTQSGEHARRRGGAGQLPARFLAVLLTALALVPVSAHLAELPSKMGLAQAPYFTVQGIYRGWALFGIVLIGAIIADVILTIVLRADRTACGFAAAGALLMIATLVVFFAWTFPMNQATRNWTVAPPDWTHARRQWEYSHAANAVLTFLALCAVLVASLRPGR